MTKPAEQSEPSPFEIMSAPDYPATCDCCGETGTNQSMETHVCANFADIAMWPCYIGEHDNCARRRIRNKQKIVCPCICHKKVTDSNQ